MVVRVADPAALAMQSPPAASQPLDAKARRSDDAKQSGSTSGEAPQFETYMIQQLLRLLRESSGSSGMLGTSGYGTDFYMSMFDEALAGHIAESGALHWLDDAGAKGASAKESPTGAPLSSRGGIVNGLVSGSGVFAALQRAADAAPTSTTTSPSAPGSLQEAAHRLAQGDAATRWGRDGALLPSDLSSDFATAAPGGEARFAVRDASGYRGYTKCNLFALEAARRAGFQVPLVARPRGWGYPSANAVTADAVDGQMKGGWAKVAVATTAERLNQDIAAGQRSLLLTGAFNGPGEHGHMAVVQRLHAVERNAQGDIQRIVFDGWEARPSGAQYLQRRSWNLYGNPGEAHPAMGSSRNGFDKVVLLELVAAPQGQAAEVPLSKIANSSGEDDFPLRSSHRSSDDPQGG